MEDSMRPFYTGWQSGDALAQGDNSRYTQYGNTALNNTGAQNHEMMQHINKLQQMYLTKTGADGKPLDQESLDYMRDFINANQFAYSQGVMTPWVDDPLAGKRPLHPIAPTAPIEMPPMPTAPVPPNPYPLGAGPYQRELMPAVEPPAPPPAGMLPGTMPTAPKSAAPKMPPSAPAKRKLKKYKPSAPAPQPPAIPNFIQGYRQGL